MKPDKTLEFYIQQKYKNREKKIQSMKTIKT